MNSLINFLTNYGLFFAETLTIVIAILVVIGGVVAIATKNKDKGKERIDITYINEKYDDMREILQDAVCSKEELKHIKKLQKAKEKKEELELKQALQEAKLKKTALVQARKAQEKGRSSNYGNGAGSAAAGKIGGNDGDDNLFSSAAAVANSSAVAFTSPSAYYIGARTKRRIFVLDFCGDMRATDVDDFCQEVTAILTVATPKDEVLVTVESAGGVISGYGLAASQLKRIRDRSIPLTVAVDKIAASGGYMMACVADRILAAPFAILGSIGVVTQMPNFSRLLKKYNIDFEQITAGEYKRTLSMFGENTNKGRQKVQEEVEEAHELFKSFVAAHRPLVNIEAIATGEYWFGTRAKELRLVDEIMTSDDYLLLASEKADLYKIEYTLKKPLMEKFTSFVQSTLRMGKI